MRSRVLWVLLLVVGLSGGGTARAASQELATREPRFLAAWAPAGQLVDASNATTLRRRVSVDLVQVRMEEALNIVINQAGLDIVFNPALLPADRNISLHAQDITVAAALTEILLNAGVDVAVSRDGQLTLAPRTAVAPLPADTGDIVGTVKDSATGAPIVGATVVVEGTGLTATTDADGGYRIAGVPAGGRTVNVRFIGYAPGSAPAVVVSGQEITVDVGLIKSVQQLDELVTTTPGGMQSQVRALPSPVTIITAEDIERQKPQTLNDVLRRAVPSAVAFDNPTSPAQTAFALRGVSTLNIGAGQTKIFIDGVQSSTMGETPLDPSSIERVEVIRGPQAATTYGPDAAGGVIQIFTKRGNAERRGSQIVAEAETGLQQTPYPGFKGVVRQRYGLSVSGRTQGASYHLGATYWRLPNWIRDDQPSKESVPSVFGAVRFARDIIAVDLSGRYQVTNRFGAFNPLLLTSGFPLLSQPNPLALNVTNSTIGAQVSITPRQWWTNRLVLGLDQHSLDQTQTRPRFTTPADSLLQLGIITDSKVFVSYNTRLAWSPSPRFSSAVSAGIDYYRLPRTLSATTAALNTNGTIQIPSGAVFNVSRTIQSNTGYFTQVELGVQDRLFLNAGIRADDNPTIGGDFGLAVSPRVGVAYNQKIGGVAFKARSSYGRAIRAPAPGQASTFVGPLGDVTLANSLLAPERQQGWDAGLDFTFGDRLSLSMTVYDQLARDLILLVTVATQPVLTYQYQNVGRVTNRGLELEGRLNLDENIQAGAQYAYVRSRIDELGPSFSGDEQVGDRPRGVPAHTAGAWLTLSPWRGTAITGGLTYVGGFKEYDDIAEFACFGGTGPCAASLLEAGTTRDFIVDYPGFAKANVTLTQKLTPQLSGYVSVKNLLNNLAYEGPNSQPVLGRLTAIGFEMRY